MMYSPISLGISEVCFFGTLSLRFGICFTRSYNCPLGTEGRFAVGKMFGFPIIWLSEEVIELIMGIPDTSIALAGGASWACLFRILVWRIWKNYNLFIFQGHPWSLREIVNNSFGWASQSFSIPKDVLSGVLDPLLEEQANGFTIFLNIDGAVRLDTGNASVEGVARDMDGQ
ncbi:hypothetical protein PVK06_019470 [Gossypium arboreum]|uniref:Uncharacterized protein n=1 Tax=Gossypium arboreum TaxID=29729 RepID=A0ABR0PJT2_GOSAR|nr:hypothetical protein PVK06_019470 [Gossypium arboreum]